MIHQGRESATRSFPEFSNDGLPVATYAGFLLFWSGATSNVADFVFMAGGTLLIALRWLRPSIATLRIRSNHVIALTLLICVLARFALPGGLMALEVVRSGLIGSVAAIIVAWLLAATTSSAMWRIGLVACTAIATGAIAVTAPPPPIDIYRVHIDASRLIVEGLDPYTQLDVPIDLARPGELVPGYPYPALNLIGYSVPAIVLDPRWVSAVSWVFLLVILGILGRHKSHNFWLLMVVATSPVAVPLILGTFTETLVALLLVATVELARRRPSFLTSFAFGLAMGTKQHLPTALPGQLRVMPQSQRWWLFFGAAVALSAGFIVSPSGYLPATIFGPSKIEPNQLSASIYGLSGGAIATPIVVAGVLALAFGWLAARDEEVPSLKPLLVSTATMIMLSANTSWNHWVLVGLLAAHTEFRRSQSANQLSQEFPRVAL